MQWADLAGTLIKAGAPVLGTALGGPAGATIGGIIGTAVAEALGVEATPEAVADALAQPGASGAVRQVEAEQGDRWAEYMLQASKAQAALATDEGAKGMWHSGWRPAMSWLLIGMWLWNAMLGPLASVFAPVPIPLVPYEHLLAFSGIWLTIYGGGHTLKSVMGGR
ncbi:3TM-type holin [Chelatococcus sp. XZ-Ab1]|uniref:3TM-type holin n=1 Tax=Chelatococcus sp. XZ-Ab1 TaxID=3034027 RepID=UPI0023E3993F|nr:3TM-type holin [Chelatococcus sp. XZ-Ab1]